MGTQNPANNIQNMSTALNKPAGITPAVGSIGPAQPPANVAQPAVQRALAASPPPAAASPQAAATPTQPGTTGPDGIYVPQPTSLDTLFPGDPNAQYWAGNGANLGFMPQYAARMPPGIVEGAKAGDPKSIEAMSAIGNALNNYTSWTSPEIQALRKYNYVPENAIYDHQILGNIEHQYNMQKPIYDAKIKAFSDAEQQKVQQSQANMTIQNAANTAKNTQIGGIGTDTAAAVNNTQNTTANGGLGVGIQAGLRARRVKSIANAQPILGQQPNQGPQQPNLGSPVTTQPIMNPVQANVQHANANVDPNDPNNINLNKFGNNGAY